MGSLTAAASSLRWLFPLRRHLLRWHGVPPWAGTGPLRGHGAPPAAQGCGPFPPLAVRMPFLRFHLHRWQEGGLLPGPGVGLALREARAGKAGHLTGGLVARQRAAEEGAQESCSPRASSLGFYGGGLVSGPSLADHADSGCFRVAHAWLSQDGCQREGLWEVVGHVASPFDLSRPLPVGGAG